MEEETLLQVCLVVLLAPLLLMLSQATHTTSSQLAISALCLYVFVMRMPDNSVDLKMIVRHVDLIFVYTVPRTYR